MKSQNSEGAIDREWMLSSNLDGCISAYDKAVLGKVGDPVVLLLDIRDGQAKRTACCFLGEETIESHVEAMSRLGMAPTVIVGMERDRAVEILGNYSLSAKRALSMPGPMVACVASGGTAYAQLPL